MKIAVAAEGQNVSMHFGHCEGFYIYEVEGGKVTNEEFKGNPGHRPGFLPVFLRDLDVKIIIAGGMGETAQQLFAENGIEVYTGVEGYCKDAIEKYAEGSLSSTNSVCREHQHEGHCNG